MDIRQLLAVRSMLLLYARYRTRSLEDAEDLVQQTYLKTLEDPSKIVVNDAAAFMTWKLKKHAHDEREKLAARQQIIDIAEVIDDLPIADQAMEQLTNRQQINYLMTVADLGEREAQAMIGVYWYGYTYDELAKLMNISPHTVKSHLTHAKDKLQILVRSNSNDYA